MAESGYRSTPHWQQGRRNPYERTCRDVRDTGGWHTERLVDGVAYRAAGARGGIKGFRIFLACIVLGVAAISGVGSLAEAFRAGLAENARALLGADVEIRVSAHGATEGQLAWLGNTAKP